jgi:pimeloyl-ACP methyl ester carboxylesterase
MAENFVLVHGAWHGGWCWASVMRQLELSGHRAFTLDLAGRGTNPLHHSKVTRELWVDNVVKLIERHDLSNVVLAGHSLGGLTISGVAVQIPKRIKRVIYVTALVPPEDMTLMDDFAAGMMTPEAAEAMQQIDGGISMTMEANHFRRCFMQDGSRDLQDFVLAALTPEATAPMGVIAPMKQFYQLDLPTSYVICEDDLVAGDPKKWHPGQSQRLRNPTTRSLKAGHELMFTQPVECAGALMDLARG